jgi:hypothetical protein
VQGSTRSGLFCHGSSDINNHDTYDDDDIHDKMYMQTVNPKCYQCPQCEKSYSRKDRLGIHLRNVHNDETCRVKGCFEWPFTCDASFRTMMSLLTTFKGTDVGRQICDL